MMTTTQTTRTTIIPMFARFPHICGRPASWTRGEGKGEVGGGRGGAKPRKKNCLKIIYRSVLL